MKKILSILLVVTFLLFSCTSLTHIDKQKIDSILPKDASEWSLEECNKILLFYTASNSSNLIFKSTPVNRIVFIKALLLNKTSVKALTRKEVIEKRLDDIEYYPILETYLKEFTSLTYDNSRKEIIEADSNFSKGYSFKIYFENISNPYKPIFLEDGYSYFFLENMNGEFSRVTEVSGLFVEDYFQLDGYLDAIITFSPFSTIGKRLFDDKNLNESYKLVFNGFRDDSIGVEWLLK
jgi:hypothetical protein